MLIDLLAAVDLRTWLVFLPIVVFAAVIYASVGFGAGIVAVPLATQFYELHYVIAILAVLELCNSARLVINQRGEVVFREARNLIVAAIPGTVLGMTLLVVLPAQWLMLALAFFILAFLVHSWFDRAGDARAPPAWAWPAGFVAGVCSALFGAGGPPYAIYLRLRPLGIERFRATMGVVGLANLVTRVAGFMVVGLYATPHVLATALALLPLSLGATLLTERVRHRVPAALLMRLTSIILLLAALSLIWRSGHMNG